VFLRSLRPPALEKNIKILALGSLDGPIDWSEFIRAEVPSFLLLKYHRLPVPDRQVFHEFHVPFVEGITLETRKTNL